MNAIDGREYFFTILFVTLVDLIKRVNVYISRNTFQSLIKLNSSIAYASVRLFGGLRLWTLLRHFLFFLSLFFFFVSIIKFIIHVKLEGQFSWSQILFILLGIHIGESKFILFYTKWSVVKLITTSCGTKSLVVPGRAYSLRVNRVQHVATN